MPRAKIVLSVVGSITIMPALFKLYPWDNFKKFAGKIAEFAMGALLRNVITLITRTADIFLNLTAQLWSICKN
jgi:hypothetical protein